MDILTILNDVKLTKNEEIMKDYLLIHKEEVKEMSIQMFASQTYSSNAGIIRFCKKLGYHGFKDFKIALIEAIEREKHTPIFQDYNQPFKKNAPSRDIFQNLSSMMISSIEMCHNYLDVDVLYHFADILNKAKQIYLYAYGDSAIRAMSFQNKLMKIEKHAIIPTLLGEDFNYSKLAKKDDVALFISYTGENKDLYQNALLLKRKTPILTISSSSHTLLAKISDSLLIIPDKENKEDAIATFYSQTCFEYILNCLYSLLYQKYITHSLH